MKFRSHKLPKNKEIRVALNNISGLSWFHTNFICLKIGLGVPYSINNLNSFYSSIIKNYFNIWLASSTVRQMAMSNHIKFLILFRTYRGARHSQYLPVHGQRSRSNANTQRSKKPPLTKEEKAREERRKKAELLEKQKKAREEAKKYEIIL